MFETSFLLCLKHLLANILLPLIPWIFFMWIFYGKKFSWMLLYFLSWFVWVGVLAFSLINLQFIHFWIWVVEYFILLLIIILGFAGKVFIKKEKITDYIKTLKIKFNWKDIKKSWTVLSTTEKVFSWIILLFVVYFSVVTIISSLNFPTYADDSFWNWNKPAVNIYVDWWIKMVWDNDEILWRWRLWYPIHIPAYKAMISSFVWGVNDIYFNMWQELVFLFGLLFIAYISFQKEKDLFKTGLPLGLICWMPLIYFHSFEGYMELPCVMYCILSIWAFYQYLEKEDNDYLSLGLLFCFILSYIKNDWFIVYVPGIVFALLIILLKGKKLKKAIVKFFKDTWNLWKTIFYFVYFFLPFLIIKLIHWLWFNQAAWDASWLWLAKTIHFEIFSVFKHIFFSLDNYNVALIPLLLIIYWALRKWDNNKKFLILTWIMVFIILLLVFLLTENYKFVLDQTTVNRVFTMTFVIIFAFSWIILSNEEDN